MMFDELIDNERCLTQIKLLIRKVIRSIFYYYIILK